MIEFADVARMEARRIVGFACHSESAMDFDDLHSIALFEAWRAQGEYRYGCKRRFVRQQVRRRLMDAVRKASPRLMSELRAKLPRTSFVAVETQGARPDIEGLVDMAAAVRRAAGGRDGFALLLASEGYTGDEIGAACGVSRQRACRLVERARSRLSRKPTYDGDAEVRL